MKRNFTTLTSMAQFVGHNPTKQRVTSLLPAQGAGLGYGFDPQSGLI